MVWNIVKDMFNNTDETGILIIKDWNAEDEDLISNPRFCKCRMNWDFDTAQKIADRAAIYCDALEDIGSYFDEADKDIYCEPDFEGSFDDSYAAQLREVWELFFGGYDNDKLGQKALSGLAEQRLGRKVNAHNAFVRAIRLVTVTKLGAPDIILDNEKYEFVRAFVLNRACEEIVFLDLSKDSFDEKAVTLGEFNEDDINRVSEMLLNDCSVMPEERIGYTMLVNAVLADIRLDLYRRYRRIKPAVDAALATVSESERKVLQMLYGLTDGVRRSHEAAALEMNIPLPMIKVYESLALRKLRHPGRLTKLEGFFSEQKNGSPA